MIMEMKKGASREQVNHIVERAQSLGFDTQLNRGTDKTVVAILGSDTGRVATDVFAVLSGVETVTRIMKPYKLVSREFNPQGTRWWSWLAPALWRARSRLWRRLALSRRQGP